jgi:integrase
VLADRVLLLAPARPGLGVTDLPARRDVDALLRQTSVESQSYLSPELERLARAAVELQSADLASSTERTYAYLNKTFAAFCQRHGLDPFAPSTVRLYVAQSLEAAESKSTLRTRIAAIAHLARRTGLPDPTVDPAVKESVANATRKLAREPRRVTPATYEKLAQLVGAIDGDAAIQVRDRALVLFGFAIGKRGHELAGVDVAHIRETDDGWLIAIPQTKTNKSGEPEYIGVPRFVGDPLCPLAAVEAWLAYARIRVGPVFRTLSVVKGRGGNRMRREDIARRLAAIARRAGLEGIFRSHSLRRGVVTSAEQYGIARSRTRLLTGWKSDAMFSVYAYHEDKVRMSPLHEIYGRRPPASKLLEA